MQLISLRSTHGDPPADGLPQNWSIPDPLLTSLGHQQCQDLAEHLQQGSLAKQVELIVVSPMRRTLETAAGALGWLMDRGVPALCRGEWQENSAKPCDTGSPISEVKAQFPQFDFSQVDSIWPRKIDQYAFTENAVGKRGQTCRAWLKHRPEKVIAVVSHSAFLRTGVTPQRFANADYRVYDFAADGDALVERSLTAHNGGGMGKSPKGKFQPQPADFEIPS